MIKKHTIVLKNVQTYFCVFFKGQYFVLGVDIEHYDADRPSKYTRGLLREDQDHKVDKAFR